MALNLGNSFGSSLLVGVCRIKLNNLTKYVELSVECLRTRVQFPPPPPISSPATSNAVLVTAFLFDPNRKPISSSISTRTVGYNINVCSGEYVI